MCVVTILANELVLIFFSVVEKVQCLQNIQNIRSAPVFLQNLFTSFMPQNAVERLIFFGGIVCIFAALGTYYLLKLRNAAKQIDDVSQNDLFKSIGHLYDQGQITQEEFRLLKIRFFEMIQQFDEQRHPSIQKKQTSFAKEPDFSPSSPSEDFLSKESQRTPQNRTAPPKSSGPKNTSSGLDREKILQALLHPEEKKE